MNITLKHFTSINQFIRYTQYISARKYAVVHYAVRWVVPKEPMLRLWATQDEKQLKQSPIQDMKLRNTKKRKGHKNMPQIKDMYNLSLRLALIL